MIESAQNEVIIAQKSSPAAAIYKKSNQFFSWNSDVVQRR